MKSLVKQFVFTLLAIFCGGAIYAQVLPGGLLPGKHYLLPANPTSADSLKLSLDGMCGWYYAYRANPYVVAMAQNNITVTLGERSVVCGVADWPRQEIDLGRLPAGNYTVTVNNVVSEGITTPPLFTNVPFAVADARATKRAPYVRLDYSGHWWDPNDAGWGLFIWQDARSPTDSVLAAWFTYTPDGKPMWYVFQPTWQTSSATVEVPLMQTSRPPGTTSPPPNPTPGVVSYTFAGTASLDFTNYGTVDEGKLTYTFTGGQKLVRTIQRFKP